ncbi:hypothetical protein F4804DRAFT_350901 [Jackrogersella minutella]|nr:hypothetical protein F4804DRAFT_350901 [Jackrogersella minutella]
MSSFPPTNVTPEDTEMTVWVQFYHPFICHINDNRDRFDQIIGWSDELLENDHKYIHWLFPLPEPSRHNMNAPLLEEETYLIFRATIALQDNMKLALLRMLYFYGFVIEWTREWEPVIREKEAERGAFHRWLKETDHNHRRISRIIRSLRIFGFLREAKIVYWQFIRTDMSWHGGVSEKSKAAWKIAAEGPLHEVPGTKEEIDWLVKYA